MSLESSRPVGAAAVQEAVAIARERRVLIAIVAVLGIIAGAVFGVASQDSESTYTMRVRLAPLSQNATVVALGVSAPAGPIAADFSNDPVIGSLAATNGTTPDAVREVLRIADVPGDPNQMSLVVDADQAIAPAPVLLRTWLAAVQRDRAAYIRRAIENARESYLEDLSRRRPMQARRENFKNLSRLAGLEGSLRTDVSVLRGPRESTAGQGRSPLLCALAGGLVGIVAGLGLALGAGLLDRRLRTPGALSAQFGLPIVADLRRGDERGTVAKRLEAVDGGAQSALVVIEAGPPGTAARAAEALSSELDAGATAIGPIHGEAAQKALGDEMPWIVAVSPGRTDANQAVQVAAEVAVLSRRPLGLVLV